MLSLYAIHLNDLVLLLSLVSNETKILVLILSTGQHLLIFIMFLCLFFIAVLMGLAGPSMTMKFTMQASTLKGKEVYKSWMHKYIRNAEHTVILPG